MNGIEGKIKISDFTRLGITKGLISNTFPIYKLQSI